MADDLLGAPFAAGRERCAWSSDMPSRQRDQSPEVRSISAVEIREAFAALVAHVPKACWIGSVVCCVVIAASYDSRESFDEPF